MSHQQYNLTWHTYTDHLKDVFKEIMASDDFVDVTLVSDDKKQSKAHRNILSACSPIFRHILQVSPKNNHPVIYLRGIQHSDIESILQFIYLGETSIDQDRIDDFLLTAKDLKIRELGDNVKVSDSTKIEKQNSKNDKIDDKKEKTKNSTGPLDIPLTNMHDMTDLKQMINKILKPDDTDDDHNKEIEEAIEVEDDMDDHNTEAEDDVEIQLEDDIDEDNIEEPSGEVNSIDPKPKNNMTIMEKWKMKDSKKRMSRYLISNYYHQAKTGDNSEQIPYKRSCAFCNFCGKMFTNLSNKERHERTSCKIADKDKIEEKKYKCSIGDCDRQFSKLGYFKKHMSAEHPANIGVWEQLIDRLELEKLS